MSYLNQLQDPRRRATAITGTLAIHVALGVVVVTGLTITGVVPPEDVWDPFTLTHDPKPKPPPPTPQPRKQEQQSRVTVPPTPLPPLGSTDNAVVPDTVSDRTIAVGPIAGPGGASIPDTIQASLFTPRRAVPANNANRWITTDDYPSRPLRDGIEGAGAYRLVVGSSGRVSACDVTRTTGNAQLDAATCRFIIQRARFEPATDETGARVIGSYTGTVRWEIPD